MITKKFEPFEKRVWLSSPTMHGEEMEYVAKAFETNWISTEGENIDEVEKLTAEKAGTKYAVALSCGTAALHLAVRLAGVRAGMKVLCSDLTFAASVNPVVYEGGKAVFIDSESDTWNMDPAALEKALELYPEARAVILVHLYGTPAKVDEIREICDRHGAVLIEDAAESLGAAYKGKQTGSFGNFGIVSFNGNKIITGSAGGCLVTDDKTAAERARKWSAQSRENAPWYQHEELGYNYRMSNVIAGLVRGQIPHLEEHIAQKKAIYERYQEAFRDLPLTMNPMNLIDSEPNYWLSCILIRPEAMCRQTRGELKAAYTPEHGKSCPTEIDETLKKYNAESRPIWKPMHLQPVYRGNAFITREGDNRSTEENGGSQGNSGDIFDRGLCLPSDIKMTVEEQDKVIEIVKSCFD